MEHRKPEPDTKAQPMDSRRDAPQSPAQPRTNVNPDNVHTTHRTPEVIPDGVPQEPVGRPATGPQNVPPADGTRADPRRGRVS